jgi:two-component system, OmpR family, response regulator
MGRMIAQSNHILVVEDDDEVREVIVQILQENNCRVSTASDGSMMRAFLETDDTVDCVVLDVIMPGEASVSLARHLKERGISVVIISSNLNAIKYAEENGRQLLSKPFRSHELHSAVNAALITEGCGQRSKAGR